MTLILTIENEQSLPNGAPVRVRLADKRGIDIGRSANLDWTLPDSTRFISGKHCEVRYRDDGYWLNDLSTNGTFLNDSPRRIQAPHKLRHGDRLTIGSYVIAVEIEAEADEEIAAEPAEISEAAPRCEPAEGPNAEIVHIAAILAPGANPSGEGFEGVKNAAAQRRRPEEGRGEAGALGILSREFVAPGRAVGSNSPQPIRLAVEPADESEGKIAFFNPPGNDRSPDPLAARVLEAQVLEAQVLEAQAWKASDRSAPASDRGAGQPSFERDGRADGEGTAPSLDEFLRHFAKGAGIPEHVFARQNGLKVAEDLGALMRMAVENLTQLLSARFKAKRFARTSSQTMIQAFDNNPLKFAPTSDDALKIMFGPRTSGYLDAKRTFEGAFTDLKTHQVKTFAAMQQAVRMLVEDLDPKAIDQSTGPDKGFAALFGGRKARLWDLYLARWQAKTLRHEDGLVDAFMLYFAECYDQPRDEKSN